MLERKERALRAQARDLGIDPRRLLSMPIDEMMAASYSSRGPKAADMYPWPQPLPNNERVSKRELRIRNCNPPRLTT